MLITRAIEPQSEADVFIQFRRHFIQAGHVDAKFNALLDLAEKKDLVGIEAIAEEVLSLAETMEKLYRKMDNSLRVPGEARKAKTP